jgi:hypothetical protein
VRYHLVVKAEDGNEAVERLEDVLTGFVIVRGPTKMSGQTWSMRIEVKHDLTEDLNAWFTRDMSNSPPYPFGSLLMWTRMPDIAPVTQIREYNGEPILMPGDPEY